MQVIQKVQGKYKVLKTIGSATTWQEIEKLEDLARQKIEAFSSQPKLFISNSDTSIEQAFAMLSNSSIRTLGPEIIFGKIYDYIGCDLDILVITDGQLRTGSIHDVTSLIEEKTIWLRNRPSDIDRFFETASVQKGGIPDKGRFARKRGYEILREILNKV